MAQPTTKELYNNIISQFESEYGYPVPIYQKSFLRVAAKVLAAVFVTLWKFAGYMLLQQFPTQASLNYTEIGSKRIRPLVEWGRLLGAGDPRFATQAELEIEFTVNGTTSGVSLGTQLIEPDNQIVFTVIAVDPLLEPPEGKYNATVRASGDQNNTFGAGVQGNLEDDTLLRFITPIVGVDTDTIVTDRLVIGAEAETEDEYKQRILDKAQKRPQGGAYADYEEWAEEIEGVINSYPYADDPGEVLVYIEAAPSIDPDGIAPGALITEVYNSIESQRPAGSLVTVESITRTALDVEIYGLAQGPVGIEDSIETALDEYFRAAEPASPISPAASRNDSVSVSGVGGVVDDITKANGAVFDSVILKLSGIPVSGRYQLPPGEKVKLGTVTYA